MSKNNIDIKMESPFYVPLDSTIVLMFKKNDSVLVESLEASSLIEKRITFKELSTILVNKFGISVFKKGSAAIHRCSDCSACLGCEKVYPYLNTFVLSKLEKAPNVVGDQKAFREVLKFLVDRAESKDFDFLKLPITEYNFIEEGYQIFLLFNKNGVRTLNLISFYVGQCRDYVASNDKEVEYSRAKTKKHLKVKKLKKNS